MNQKLLTYNPPVTRDTSAFDAFEKAAELDKMKARIPSVVNRQLITAGEVFAMEKTQTDWLWENFIPYGHIVMIAAPADVGKSILCRQLSYSISAGRNEMLGRGLNPKSRRVIYVSTEENLSDWKTKLDLLDLSEEEKKSISKNLLIAVDISDVCSVIKEEIERSPVDLIVLDVLMDLYQDDINNPIKVRQFFAPFKKLAEHFGLSIIFVHHVSKAGEDKGGFQKTQVLGSTSLVGGPRSVLLINRDKEDNSLRVINITKGNLVSDEEKNKLLKVRLNDNLLFDLASEEIKSTVNNKVPEAVYDRVFKLATEEKLSVRQITERLNSEGIKIGKTKVAEILNSKIEGSPVIFTTKNQ
jgi:RecA-family ATPase